MQIENQLKPYKRSVLNYMFPTGLEPKLLI